MTLFSLVVCILRYDEFARISSSIGLIDSIMDDSCSNTSLSSAIRLPCISVWVCGIKRIVFRVNMLFGVPIIRLIIPYYVLLSLNKH